MQAEVSTTQEPAPQKLQKAQQQESEVDSNHIPQVTSQTIDNMVIRVRDILSSSKEALDTDVQHELAKLLNVLRKAKKLLVQKYSNRRTDLQAELETLVLNVNVAIDALYKNPSKILARKVRQDAEYAIRSLEKPLFAFFANYYQRLLNSTTVATRVLVGLLIALPVNLSLASFMISSLDSVEAELTQIKIISNSEEVRQTDAPVIYVKDFREGYTLIILSFISGSVGSIISIFSRINEYTNEDENLSYQDPQLPIFIGLFKPIIGERFGIVTYAIITSGIVPMISLKSGNNRTRTYLQSLMVMSVTFVAGFSERLAKALATSTENRFNYGANFNHQQQRGLKMPIEQVDSTNGSYPKEKQGLSGVQ